MEADHHLWHWDLSKKCGIQAPGVDGPISVAEGLEWEGNGLDHRGFLSLDPDANPRLSFCNRGWVPRRLAGVLDHSRRNETSSQFPPRGRRW